MKNEKCSSKNKNKREKVATLFFIGLTIGSTTFLGYSTFLWISVARFYRNLQNNITVDQVQIIARNEKYFMNVTVSIWNELVCSYTNIYIALEKIIVDGNIISLVDYYKGPVHGTFTRVIIAPLSKVPIEFSFILPENFPDVKEELKFVIKVLATTIINKEPQTVIIIKSPRVIIT